MTDDTKRKAMDLSAEATARLVRLSVATHLRGLAHHVEVGNVLELEVVWRGGTEIDQKVRLAKPVEFVVIRPTVSGEKP